MTAETKATLQAAIILAALIAFMFATHAADTDGRYAQSPNREWVKSLHSPAGSWCCDISDGHALVDADWEVILLTVKPPITHYRVRIEGNWIDVPSDAVIPEPNKIGQTIVWFVHQNGKPVVTCFLPGALS